ncbi:DUF4003 family protein [Bacillus atrophaeus]|uniref:DUF4003 family protein n=1 Tax=Bacillus atrophaeus TaxID=1452 RepID=UPI0040410921
MLTSELQNNVNNYISIYTELKKQLKWKIAHEGLLMLTASAYIVNKREFDFRRFYDLSNYIKANVGMFSTLNSHHRFTIASILDIHFQDKAKEQFQAFSDLYEDMLKQGFKRDIFTYLSALIVLTGKSEQKTAKEIMSAASSIYQLMKQQHYFLTSTQNYPFAVMLAGIDKEKTALMEQAESSFQKLSAAGFKKGQNLQFLSQILALHQEKDTDELASRCHEMFRSINELYKKPKDIHYPDIDLLTFLEEPEKDISTVIETVQLLNKEKALKWHKDINFKIAVSLFMGDTIEKNLIAESGLYAVIETVLQAQQAASTAAIISTTAAAHSAHHSSGTN